MIEELSNTTRCRIRDEHCVWRVSDLWHSDDFRMMIEEHNFLGAEREISPELSESSGVIGVHDNPKVPGIPEFYFTRAEQDCIFWIQESVSLRQEIWIINSTRFFRSLQIVEKC